MPPIRLVTFDALHTLFTPRVPIAIQYAEIFAPYLGELKPENIDKSFKVALQEVRAARPAYKDGTEAWWSDVISRTALGAGADKQLLEGSLEQKIVPKLMRRFIGKEGWRPFGDAIPTLRKLLAQNPKIRVAIVSNSDLRTHVILRNLGFFHYVKFPVILSETEGIEKPDPEIFLRAIKKVNAQYQMQPKIIPQEALHIGDDLHRDYYGALGAGMQAMLLRRVGEEHAPATNADLAEEDLEGVNTVGGLVKALKWIGKYNKEEAQTTRVGLHEDDDKEGTP